MAGITEEKRKEIMVAFKKMVDNFTKSSEERQRMYNTAFKVMDATMNTEGLEITRIYRKRGSDPETAIYADFKALSPKLTEEDLRWFSELGGILCSLDMENRTLSAFF